MDKNIQSEIYPVYQKNYDMTFIMERVMSTLTGECISEEVVGFYYGEPDEQSTHQFYGDRKAVFIYDVYDHDMTKMKSGKTRNRRYLAHVYIQTSEPLVPETLANMLSSFEQTANDLDVECSAEVTLWEEL